MYSNREIPRASYHFHPSPQTFKLCVSNNSIVSISNFATRAAPEVELEGKGPKLRYTSPIKSHILLKSQGHPSSSSHTDRSTA
jgi:hypothetical protein